MNYTKACETLEIPPNQEWNLDILKKHYRLQALKYHPDKNKSEGSVARFQSIHDSYEFLKKYEDFDLEDEDPDPDMEENYQHLLSRFIRHVLQNETFQSILMVITSLCEEKAAIYLKRIDEKTLEKIAFFMVTYKEVLHFSDGFLETIHSILREKKEKKEVVVHVSMDDLFENNLYKLTHDDMVYFIPVWHHELIYDLSGDKELRVTCCPVLEKNVKIDSENNIFVDVLMDVRELLDNQNVTFFLGKKKWVIDSSVIVVLPYQTIYLEKQGIPRPDAEDIFNVEHTSDIVVSLSIF